MKKESEKCISLPYEGCWEIAEGDVDSIQFIDLLAVTFPEATIIYIEGTSIEADVRVLFEEYAEQDHYLPKGQVIWPKSECIRCVFSEEFLKKLSGLAENHAEPELFDHFFLYSEETPLLEWPDAFSNCIWISTVISESRAKAFAEKLGLPCRYVKDG